MELPLPHDGDTVMFCEHADVGDDHIHISANFHWHYFSTDDGGPMVAERDDGTELRCHWLAICDACEMEFKDPFEAARQDAPWIGPAPETLFRVV